MYHPPLKLHALLNPSVENKTLCLDNPLPFVCANIQNWNNSPLDIFPILNTREMSRVRDLACFALFIRRRNDEGLRDQLAVWDVSTKADYKVKERTEV